jgi:hypothetical protein
MSHRYVAEMMKNRVLRFFQKPEGVYHGSVFYQLSGGVRISNVFHFLSFYFLESCKVIHQSFTLLNYTKVGPSSLALDAQGSLYIGQFETRGKEIARF